MSDRSSPRWLRVSDHDDFPAEPDSPRVDLNRCRLWIREKITRQGHYAGETCLYENAGGRWFVFSVHVKDFTRETSEHGWWARRSEVVEWFLRHPDVEPPAELRAELDGFDATEAPAASEPKREPPPSSPTPAPATEAPAERLPDYVTLDQAAAAAHRHKRTLERYKTDGSLPPPDVEGGGGKFDLWDWPNIRPWLEKKFGVRLPKRFFDDRR